MGTPLLLPVIPAQSRPCITATLQAALVLWHAASHWPQLAWGIDGSQMLVLAVYCLTLGVLCLKWHGQLSLQLSSVLLIALLEPGLLFWQDITGVQPDGTFDSEHVARWACYQVQAALSRKARLHCSSGDYSTPLAQGQHAG